MKTLKVNYFQTKASKSGISLVFAATIVFLIAGTGSAFAATPVVRNLADTTFTGACCIPFGEIVSISEPVTLKAAIVTWNSGYTINVSDDYFAGLSVNGGPCETLSYGARAIPNVPVISGGNFLTVSFTWVVLPSDGVLFKGLNTFSLCGGGASAADSITVHHNTLSVQLSK